MRTTGVDSGDAEQVLELREEELVVNKELRDRGEVVVRTIVDEVPGRLEADALREEVEIEHEPAGEAVNERRQPWQEGDTLVVPIYEEQLVVVKRLVMKERIRIRRVATTERRLFEDVLRRERLIIEDPAQPDLVHEVFPSSDGAHAASLDESGESPAPRACSNTWCARCSNERA